MRETPFEKKKPTNETPHYLNALRNEELQTVGFISTCCLLWLCLSSGTLPMLQKTAGVLSSTTILSLTTRQKMLPEPHP